MDRSQDQKDSEARRPQKPAQFAPYQPGGSPRPAKGPDTGAPPANVRRQQDAQSSDAGKDSDNPQ
jgi:hypothetical protein